MKPINPNSRTQRMLRFIAASAEPVTHEEIVAAVRADPADAKTKDLGCKVSATLCGLVDAEKVKRTGAKFAYRYERTHKTLAASPRTATAPTTRVSRPAVTHQPSVAANGRRTEAAAPTSKDKPAPFVVPNAALTPPRHGQIGSEQIAADIATFQKRGGRIERLKQGESSHSIRAKQEAFLDSRGRGQARPKASASAAVSRTNADNDDTLDADDLIDVA